MGLEVPELDDREYADILADARKRIPVHSTEWTDHNVHDPGITILETLSWLAETYVYQLDQVTDAHRRKYLKLMGERPRPPKSATVGLTLGRRKNGTMTIPEELAGRTIPNGEKLRVEDGTGSERVFETTEDVTLTRARIETVISEHREGRVDNSIANRTDGMYFSAFGSRAERGSVLYLGFDGDPFAASTRLDIWIDLDERELPEPASHGEEGIEFEPSVEVSWQHCATARWYRDDSWRDMRTRRDGTNHLYRGGVVTLEKPADWREAESVEVLDQEAGFHWIRCVLKTSGYEVPPRIDSLQSNVVTAQHRSNIEGEVLQRSDRREETTALPNQRTYFFEKSPVLSASSASSPVLEAGIAVGKSEAEALTNAPWKGVEDFDASGPDDEHYVLDASRGAIRFGDGIRGALPEAGQKVVAKTYTRGGGRDGNVPESSSWRFVSEELRTLPVSARGPGEDGEDAESVAAALSRLRKDLETPYRAVSPADYRYIAKHTPGLRFGRAKALVERGREIEGCGAENTIRLIVVPFSTLSKPEPSEGFLNAVRRHVEKHRLLTDRVRIDPPTYVDVGVNAEVRIARGYVADKRVTEIENALDEFLDPLGRIEGEGWPFGRTLYKSEVYATIENVEGVDAVLSVSLTARGERGIDDDGNVLIGESALLCPADHDVTVTTTTDGASFGRNP